MNQYGKTMMMALFVVCAGAMRSHAGINIAKFAPFAAGDHYAVANTSVAAVSLQASPASIARGATSVVTATVLNGFGQPVAGMPVTFSIQSGPGSLSSTFAMTDGSGKASVVFTAPDQFPGKSVDSRVKGEVSSGPPPYFSGEAVITTTKK